MNTFIQITTSDFSPAFKATTVLRGIISLFVATKVGQVATKPLFILLGLASLGGAIWWLLAKYPG